MRQVISLNRNWLYHKGDIVLPPIEHKGPVYTQSKTVRKQNGPAAYGYIDTPNEFLYDMNSVLGQDNWYSVDLPHDYIIEQAPEKENNSATGYFEYHNAWYRKHFTLPENGSQSKRVLLYFEGIAGNSTIYLNGCLMKRNFSAYNGFCVDISDTVYFGKDNVLAVFVDRSEYEGWWYQGGGIYRNVKLIVTEPLAIDLFGVYAPAVKINDTQWRIDFKTTVVNDSDFAEEFTLISRVLDSDGREIALAKAEAAALGREKTDICYSTVVENPKLWDCEAPNLYTVETCILKGDCAIDSDITRIGFRTVELQEDKGLLLNGKPIYIKGVCCHQDYGLTGLAVPDNVARYKIKLIKEMGANGFRTSHYENSPAVMDSLDELGFIVMNESRHFESTEEGLEQVRNLVKRDRNRPSVVFWSTGNEEPLQSHPWGRKIHNRIKAEIRKYTCGGFIMSAQDRDVLNSTVYEDCDLIGVNYNLQNYDALHEKYPHKLILASECCATGTTRDWHFHSTEDGKIRDFDANTSSWFMGRELTWKFLKERFYVIGAYQWIAIEHRGEAMWPYICSKSGAIDLFLQKKNAFYQNKSHWSNTPMVHIVPHWNFGGLEGEKISVTAYTNCEELEFFLNGKSLGKQKIEKYGRGCLDVEYAAGELSVKGYIGGRAVAEDTRKTVGKPEKLCLTLNNEFSFNGEDLALFTCECLDKEGNAVPTACEEVSFSVSRPAKIVGTGSDTCDHLPVNLPQRKMYMGKISVAVKPFENTESFTLTAQSAGCGITQITVVNNHK